jgi:selenium metabolism protein YedF
MNSNASKPDRPVVVLSSQTVGSGDDGLGAVLMRSFVKTLVGLPEKPAAVVFQNGGVLLTVDDSPLLEDLRALETAGVVLLVCGTCLDWFERRSRLAVGAVSNMHDIASLLLAAPSVIRA